MFRGRNTTDVWQRNNPKCHICVVTTLRGEKPKEAFFEFPMEARDFPLL